MQRAYIRAITLSALILALVGVIPGLAVTREFHQTYPLQRDGTVELQNVNGLVDVQGWDRNEVEVRAVKTAKNKESDLDRVAIDVESRPDAISITSRYPQNEGVEVVVDYVVHVPHNAHVEHLGTVNGALKISGVENVEDLHTVNGNIEVFDAASSVHAHTTNGNVHLELYRLAEKTGATAETTNGSLLLAVPSDLQAEVDARCLNGTFSSELPIAMESNQRPREIHGRLGRGGAPLHLRTVNGGVRLVILRATV